MASEDTADRPAHELLVSTMMSQPAGAVGRRPNSSSVLVATCSCGWESGTIDSARAARRVFERHVQKAERGGDDRSQGRAPDERREVVSRHTPEEG